ncbi:MAG: hypothetical protein JNJ46_00290 [Myxococcales bacterium]|nr:hypothetical protein [Myxococcales bacterium]
MSSRRLAAGSGDGRWLARSRAALAGLWALTLLGCSQDHAIGSAGFWALRIVDPQLRGLVQPVLAAGDLDGDGRDEIAVLDAAEPRLCLLWSQPGSAAICQSVASEGAPQQVAIARLLPETAALADAGSGPRAQLVLAGRQLVLYPPFSSGPIPEPRLRIPLASPVQQLLRQRIIRAASPSAERSEQDILWSSGGTERIVAWVADASPDGRSAHSLWPVEYALQAAPSVVLPHSPAGGDRQILSASALGIERLTSRGERLVIPCSESAAGSRDLALLDLDADGRDDLLFLRPTGLAGWMAQKPGTGSPSWSCPSDPPAPLAGVALQAFLPFDVDGEGRIDLVASSSDRDPGLLLLRSGRPLGTYPQAQPIHAATRASLDPGSRADVVLLLRDGTLQHLFNTFPP